MHTVRHDICFSSGQECVELMFDNVTVMQILKSKDMRFIELCILHFLGLASQGFDPIATQLRTGHQRAREPPQADRAVSPVLLALDAIDYAHERLDTHEGMQARAFGQRAEHVHGAVRRGRRKALADDV